MKSNNKDLELASKVNKQDLSINKFKNLVSMAQDLSEPVNYFFDMLDSNFLTNEFYKNDEPKEIKILLEVIKNEINKRFHLNIKLKSSIFRRTTDKQIYDGLCDFSDLLSPVIIIYVVDLKIAVVCFHHNQLMEFFRLSLSNKPHTFN